MKKIVKSIRFLLPLILVLLTFATTDEQNHCRMAPLNPLFLNHQQAMYAGVAVSSPNYGRVPPPVAPFKRKIPSELKVLSRTMALPVKFDLRQTGRVTPIRDQGNCGSCWAHGAFASLESFLMPVKEKSFSPEHLVVNHGFDYGPCSGGHDWMTMAYLARWGGPLNEDDQPYQQGSAQSSSNHLLASTHIQEVIFLPERENFLDNNLIKSFVYNSGAVAISYYASNQYLNNATAAYYCNQTLDANHEVAIVGWDDNYPASNFRTPPPGNGAFIVKNSWGRNWGESGFFYMSYYDKSMGWPSAFHNAEEITNYGTNYHYDPLGWCTEMGYRNPVAWAANVFEASNNQPIVAVALMLTDLDCKGTIRIYRHTSTSNPATGLLVIQQNFNKTYPGYYTIKLNAPVAVNKGDLFSVVVRIENGGGYGYPIAVEYPFKNYSSAAVANPGESFISANGSSWEDLSYYKANACIKAFSANLPLELNCTVKKERVTSWMVTRYISRIAINIPDLQNREIAKVVIFRKKNVYEPYQIWKEITANQFSSGSYNCTDAYLEENKEYRYKIAVADLKGSALAVSDEFIIK